MLDLCWADVFWCLGAGEVWPELPGVHHPRDEPVPRAEQDQAHHTQGDWEDGPDHSEEIHLNSSAAETGDGPSYLLSTVGVPILISEM